MPADPTRRPRRYARPPFRAVRLVLIASVALLIAGCSLFEQRSVILSTVGVPAELPQPTCGGLKVLIEGALPCDQIASRAIDALVRQAPGHMARGVTAIDVNLAPCPSGAVDQNVDCLGNEIAQYVTVTFGPRLPDSPVEPSLIVVLDPVSGQLLGFENPLIR